MNRFKLTLLLFALGLIRTSDASAESQSIPINTLEPQVFCKGLRDGLTHAATLFGKPHLEAQTFGISASHYLVEQLKLGRASDYLPLDLQENLFKMKHHKVVPHIPLGRVFATAFGIGTDSVLALSAAELRYIPQTPPGSHLIVIARHGAGLSPERVASILNIAQEKRITVSLLWHGDGPLDEKEKDDAKALSLLVSKTGGIFVALNADQSVCGQLL